MATANNMDSKKPEKPVTTMMLSNLPCSVSVEELMGTLDKKGFNDCYNLVHLVSAIKPEGSRRPNLGYAFVNFLSPEHAEEFARMFEGFVFRPASGKKCIVRTSTVQGFSESLTILRRSMRKSKHLGPIVLRF